MVSPIAPGDLLADRYRVVDELGRGGMGVVLRCVDDESGDEVAVKVLGSEDRSAERLLREARAAASLTSSHVVRVLDAGLLDGGAPFFVMELLAGRTLRDELDDNSRLAPDLACDLTLQICDALAEAHQRGIVHRDLKPSNLHLEGRHVRVLDFGIAKMLSPIAAQSSLTAAGTVMGSPRYMSPEQLRDATSVDARSDIWSLGVVLYEMLTGRPPFDAESAEGLCAMIAADPPAPLDGVDGELEHIVLRCLQKARRDRFVNIGALAEAIAPFAADASKVSQIRNRFPDPLEETAATDEAEAPHATEAPSEAEPRWAMPSRRVGLVVLGVAALSTAGFIALGDDEPMRARPAARSGALPQMTAAVTAPDERTAATLQPSAAAPDPSVAVPEPTAIASAPLPVAQPAAPVPSASAEVVERNDPLDDRR